MEHSATLASSHSSHGELSDKLRQLQHEIEHAAHLLPSQGPIRIFVHHNTLHAFEHESFDKAVKHGAATFGCHPYLPEARYHEKLDRGRIQPADLPAVLQEDLGEEADRLLGFMGTRFNLRLAMLQYPLRIGGDAELRWLVAETDALRRFREEAPDSVRAQMVDSTRRWVMRDLRTTDGQERHGIRDTVAVLFDRFGAHDIQQWSPATWEAFTLNLLWRICHQGVHGAPRFGETASPPVRHREALRDATGFDIDQLVDDVLIRFCAAFLDQGLANESLPARESGFLNSFIGLYGDCRPVESWLRPLPKELARIAHLSPLQIIEESLQLLGVHREERQRYLEETMLALRGWAGMIWQLETNAEWTVHPAPRGTLVEYVAVRLVLERLALAFGARESLAEPYDLAALRTRLHKGLPHESRVSVDQRAFLVFQLAQVLGWNPVDLQRLSKTGWSSLIQEIEGFSSVERRRVYHLAYERRYRIQTLDAVLAHAGHGPTVVDAPKFQVITCIDDREESFRRHLEEIEPQCETFGVAGFFGVAMYYRGAGEAHFVPLCPIVVKPNHFVQEEVVYTLDQSHRRRAETRKAIGKASHRMHTGSRRGAWGAIMAVLGSLASVPLVARVLFPRLTARIRRTFGRLVEPPPVTRLLLERTEPTPGSDIGHCGYSVVEMTNIVEIVLRDIGLTRRFARVVIVTGHGSSSLNNPHQSAYDCGACGGGQGGPNARAFAAMASDPRVRERLAAAGLAIPVQTVFIGAFHNTCDDSISYHDLDRLPSSHHADFEAARAALEEARRRNAHERCRRFASAEFDMTLDAALRHVEARSEDLSQVRPELGHATNSLCFVGRRSRTRGLFLDRRAFLTSYDPTEDTADTAILTRILQAVIPVCAGINLEYYFSYVDSRGYGCGSKLPHNIASLVGVMDGAASDLRTGLPWQMVEIHEPVRLLFIVETTPTAMLSLLDRNPSLAQLARHDWVQLATLSPDGPEIQVFRAGAFVPYQPTSADLPEVQHSADWYRGWRDHLGFARINANHLAFHHEHASNGILRQERR